VLNDECVGIVIAWAKKEAKSLLPPRTCHDIEVVCETKVFTSWICKGETI